MRKIKRLFMMISSFLIVVTTVFVFGIKNNSVYAATTPVSPYMSLDYMMVSKADYTAYYNQFDDTANGVGLQYWLDDITTYIKADVKYKQNPTPINLMQRNNAWNNSVVNMFYSISFEDAYKKVFRPDLDPDLSSKAITSITGTTPTDVVIIPIATPTGLDIVSAQMVLKTDSFANSATYIALTPTGPTAQNNSSYAGGNIQVGWADPSASGGFRIQTGYGASLGAISVSLKSSISGNVELQMSTDSAIKAQNMFQTIDSSGTVQGYALSNAADVDHFDDHKVSVSASTPSSDATVTSIKVNGSEVYSSTAPTETSTGYQVFTYGTDIDIEASATVNATVVATVKDSGTSVITYGDSLANFDVNAASASGSIDMTKAKTGDFMYVHILTTSNDSTGHENYIVKIPTKKSAKTEIGPIDITSTIPTGYSYLPGQSKINKIDAKTPTSAAVDADGLGFAPSSSNDSSHDYCITVGEEADSITLEPTYTNTMTVTVNGSAPTSTSSPSTTTTKGTFTVSGTDIEHGDIITIKVTAQNGTSTRTYKFKVNRISRNIKLSSLDIKAGSTSLGTFDPVNQIFTTNSNVPVGYTTTAISASANVDAVNGVRSKVTIKYGLTATPTTSSTNNKTTGAAATATVTYSTTVTPAGSAQTAYFEIIVSDDLGNNSAAIKVSIARDAADNTIDLKFPDSTAEAEVSTYDWTTRSWTTTGASGNTTSMITATPTLASNTYTYATQPFGTRYVVVNLTPLKTTTKYYSDAARTKEITGQNYRITLFSSTPTAVGASPSTVIYAKTEAGNAQFNLSFPYDPGDTDSKFTYQIRAKNTSTNTWDIISKNTAGYYVFDKDKYQTGTFEIVNVVPNKTTTTMFTSMTDNNLTSLTSTLYNSSDTFTVDIDNPVYLTGVAQAQGTYFTKETIKTMTTEDQDNAIKNIKIYDTTNSSRVLIPFTFNDKITSYTVLNDGAHTPATGQDFAVYVDFEVTTIKFDVEQNSSKSSFIVGQTYLGNNHLNPSSSTSAVINSFDFQLKSKDGTPGTKYTIHVYRKDGNHDQYLTGLNINGYDMYGGTNNTTILENYTKNSNSMDFVMPRGTNNASLTFTISDKAKFTIVDGTTSPAQVDTNFPVSVADGTYQLVTIYVFSEFNKIEYPSDLSKANAYKIYIYCADQDYAITDINLLKVSDNSDLVSTTNGVFTFVPTTKDYSTTTFVAPYKDNATINLEVERNAYTSYVTGAININGISHVDSTGTISLSGINPVNISNTASTINIKVQSEFAKLKSSVLSTYNGQTENYKIKLQREKASTVNTLDTIKIVIGSHTYNIPADGYTKYEYDSENNQMNPSVPVVLNADNSISESNKIILTGIDKTATLASIIVTKTDEKATVTGDTGNVQLNLISNSVQTLRIYVTPESADSTTVGQAVYEIQVAREGVEFEGVNDISDVSMVDSEAKEYLDGAYEFVATTTEYGTAASPIIIPASQSTILFTISKKAPTSKVYQFASGTSTLLSNDKKSFTNLVENQLYTFEFYCTSENGTEGTHYTVYFKRSSYNKDATLKSLTVNGSSVKTDPFDPTTGFDKTKEVYTVYVPYETTTAVLVGVPTESTSTIKSNDAETPINLNEGSNVFAIVVQSEDPETSKSYKVTVIRDTNSSLDDLQVLDDNATNLITYNPTEKNYTGIEVEYSNETVTFDYTLAGDQSLLSIELYKVVNSAEVKLTSPTAAQRLTSGKNTYILKIQTASKAITSYKVEITRKAGQSDAYITSYITEDGQELEMLTNKFIYSYIVPTNITTFAPTYTISDGARVTFEPTTSKSITSGAKTRFQISVQSEDKSVTNDYSFDVYCASKDFEIKDIQALTKYRGDNIVDTADQNKYVSFDDATQKFTTGDTDYEYELHVAYSVSNFYLKTSLKNDKAKVYVNGAQANDQSYELSDSQDNVFKIQVYSEYATIPGAPDADKYKSKEYKLTIIREEPNSNVDLKELTVNIGTKTYTLITDATIQTSEDFKVSGNLFTIENVSDTATAIKAYAEPVIASPQTSMVASFASSVAKDRGYNYTDSLVTYNESNGTGYNFTYTITVKGEGENPESITYTIQVSRGKFNVENYNELHYITVIADGVEYFGKSEFVEGNAGPYEVEIPYISSQNYTINAYIPAVATGETIYIDNVYQPSGNKVVSFRYPTTGDYKKTHTVYGCNSDLEKGTEYVLNITIKAPSNDVGLVELSIEGNNIIDLFDETGSYEYPKFPNDRVDPISVRVIAASELSSITIYRMNDTYQTAGIGTANALRTLKEGTQTLTVVVTAQSGKTDSYNIILTKSKPDPYLINLEVPGEDLLDVNNIIVEQFDPKTFEYKVTVAYTTTSATINASVAAENSNYTVTCKDAITASGQVRSFPVTLNEGTNTFKINLATPEGQTNTYTLTIKRRGVASTNTNISEINLVARETKDVLMETEDFSNDVREYFYTVPNDVRNVDVTLFDAAQANPDGATYRVLNNTNLAVGNNEVIILVTSEDKKTSSAIIVNVEREPNQFDIAVKEIDEFRDDFTNDVVKEKYTVKSNISELNFTVKDRVTGKELTYEVSGGENLVAGEETEVKLTIKAADGTFTTETLTVYREPMSYKVDKEAYKAYVCTEAPNAAQINTAIDKYYVINMGKDTADKIEDYATYITEMSEGVTAKVISNPDSKAAEVIVKVENSDGTEVNYVHFQIDTTANRGSLFDWLFWIILGLAIIILIIILICVNRDKYGSVSKKRKKAQ